MFRYALICSLVLLSLNSCDREKEALPAYLHLDSFALTTESFQGNNIHLLKGVQVLVNNRFMGSFPLPCDIPVIVEGDAKVQIQAMVLENGSASVFKPFVNTTILDTTLNFSPLKTTSISSIPIKYRTNAEVVWVEDFEDLGSTLIPNAGNNALDTQYITKTDFSLEGKFNHTTNALYSRIQATDSFKYYDLRSFSYFSGFPINGTAIMMEFDVKGSDVVQLGLQRKSSSGEEYVPYIEVYPSPDKWKRFYVNLAYEIAGQPASNEYRFVYTVYRQKDNPRVAEIYLDNIRLTYLK